MPKKTRKKKKGKGLKKENLQRGKKRFLVKQKSEDL